MLILNRIDYGNIQTLGFMTALDDLNVIYTCKTLELPWKQNQNSISCIPGGTYSVKKHTSPHFSHCFWIQNVPGRSEILIHKGNFYTDILGCILVGSAYSDINQDGYLDVKDSTNTINHLYALMPENFTLKIYGEH